MTTPNDTPTPSATTTPDGLLIQHFPPLGLFVSASEHNYMVDKQAAKIETLERESARLRVAAVAAIEAASKYGAAILAGMEETK